MEYNIKILKKTGTDGYYKYKGTFDRTSSFLWKTIKESCIFELSMTVKYDLKDNHTLRFFYNGEWEFYKDKELINRIITKGKSIKSEDECCVSPDMELCGSYPLHDILLCHVIDNYELVDYCFKKTKQVDRWIRCSYSLGYEGHIEFKYNNETYRYYVWLDDKIKEYACLNCRSCNKTQEKEAINKLETWFKDKIEVKKRKQKAKEICECEEAV